MKIGKVRGKTEIYPGILSNKTINWCISPMMIKLKFWLKSLDQDVWRCIQVFLHTNIRGLILKIFPRGWANVWQSRNPAKTIFRYGSLLGYSLVLHYVLDNWTVAVKSWRPAYIDRSVLRADTLSGHAKRSVGQLNNIQTSSAFVVSTLT